MGIKDGSSKQRITELEEAYNKRLSEISRLEFTIGELRADIARLHLELQQQRGLKRRAHDFYRALDDAIIHQIDKRGFNHKPAARHDASIDIKAINLDDKRALVAAAQIYDVQAYFRWHGAKHAMRLPYRIVSKSYRIARDTALFAAKGSYRVARKVIK